MKNLNYYLIQAITNKMNYLCSVYTDYNEKASFYSLEKCEILALETLIKVLADSIACNEVDINYYHHSFKFTFNCNSFIRIDEVKTQELEHYIEINSSTND